MCCQIMSEVKKLFRTLESGMKIGCYREIMILFKYVDNGLFWKTFRVLHSVVHMKNGRNSCVRNEKRELKKEAQTLDLFSPPHSWPISGRECRIVRFGKLQKWSPS